MIVIIPLVALLFMTLVCCYLTHLKTKANEEKFDYYHDLQVEKMLKRFPPDGFKIKQTSSMIAVVGVYDGRLCDASLAEPVIVWAYYLAPDSDIDYVTLCAQEVCDKLMEKI